MTSPPAPLLLRVSACGLAGVLSLLVIRYGWAQPDGATTNASRIVGSSSEPITPIPQPEPDRDGRAGVGEALFTTPLLSHDNRRSCSSCHDLVTNGADGRSRAQSPSGTSLTFNTPTVFNATLSFRQNWEGNIRTPEEQVEYSLLAAGIMNTSWDEVLGKLKANDALAERFQRVYGHAPDRLSVIDAITAFERRLLTPDSRFDRWLRGEDAVLSAEELRGYRLFKSIGCVSCHQGVNIGANLFQRTNIFHPLFDDPGKVRRVASLRNVAATAPYFDDGSAKTLAEAVQRMGQAQLGRHFDDDQLGAILAFLKTLTGTYRGHRLSASPQAQN